MSYLPQAPLSFHFSELWEVIVITDTVKEQKRSPEAICRYFLSQQVNNNTRIFFGDVRGLFKTALSFGSPCKESDIGRGYTVFEVGFFFGTLRCHCRACA